VAAEIDPTTGLPLNTAVVIELPLSVWHLVLRHLNCGVYREVVLVVNSIMSQDDTQLMLLMNNALAAKALSRSEAATTSESVH
jgi:hypothetical protein